MGGLASKGRRWLDDQIISWLERLRNKKLPEYS